VPPQGWRGPAEVGSASRRGPSPSLSLRSAPQPGRHAPSTGHCSPQPAPRPSPVARLLPDRPRKHPPWFECTSPGVHPARPLAGTPASSCPSARPPQGRREHRTTTGTSRASSSTWRGSRISLEPDPLAPANRIEDTGEKSDQGTLEREKRRATSLE
jgi:hypothetical protein